LNDSNLFKDTGEMQIWISHRITSHHECPMNKKRRQKNFEGESTTTASEEEMMYTCGSEEPTVGSVH